MFLFQQVLKQDISKARLRIMEPLLKGPAGLDYLKNAFANHYGSPSEAFTSLPLTVRWLSSLLDCKDQEWEEHTNSLAALMSNENSTHGFLPSTTLRTGGNFPVKTNGSLADKSTGMILDPTFSYFLMWNYNKGF